MRATINAVRDALPRGRSLPPEQWHVRHRVIVQATVAVSVLLFGFLLVKGWTLAHAVAEGAVPAVLVMIAWYARWGMRARASIVAFALMSAAAIAVHATSTIEAHFLFFIAVPVVALYEDWAPFATSIGTVVGHHLLVGLRDPGSLYNHEAALQAPFRWALIHGVLFLAMCVVSVVHWRTHERARSALARQALHDPLTGLPNRTLLLDRLELALSDRARTDASVAVLMLDIDGFKPVNDTFGHSAGDGLLVELAARLGTAVRPGDTTARLGGDEFAVVLPGASAGDAVGTAQRLIQAASAPFPVAGEEISVGVSVGIAVTSAVPETAQRLLDRADAALLTAKRSGRGTSTLHHAEMREAGSEALVVSTGDARAWAKYLNTLRAEIAEQKRAGGIPESTRAPASAHRTLGLLLAGITQLPGHRDTAALSLPERSALEEFVFHHAMVQQWADDLVDDGVLTARRCPAADRFWAELHRHVVSQPGKRATDETTRQLTGTDLVRAERLQDCGDACTTAGSETP